MMIHNSDRPMIRVKNLSKQYNIGIDRSYKTLGETITKTITSPIKTIQEFRNDHETFWALKDVSFEVNEGEVVGVIGRNGAGKSTLLKVLSQITHPTEGEIHLHGRVGSLLEVGTGFHPELTGRENIYFNGAILGMNKREIDLKFDEIVKFAEIEKFLDTPVKRYSSGMYVRLAFAVAAHMEPEILLVDEVLAVGDLQFQKKCLGKMGNVAKEGRTILFVSHNMGAVNRLCSRCIFLQNGQLVDDGPTNDIVQEYIRMTMNKGGEYQQNANPAKKVNLRQVSLISKEKNQIKTEFRYDEPFSIQIDYEINESVRDCTVWCALETPDGIMVFTTADYDTDQKFLENREIGYYRNIVDIPLKWLNYGEYMVIVGIVQNNPVIVYDRVEALQFSIVEIGSPSSMHASGTRRGVLQPVIPWKMEKIS